MFGASGAAILPKVKEFVAFGTMPWHDALAGKHPTTDGGGATQEGVDSPRSALQAVMAKSQMCEFARWEFSKAES